jgi:hypothetical protein
MNSSISTDLNCAKFLMGIKCHHHIYVIIVHVNGVRLCL